MNEILLLISNLNFRRWIAATRLRCIDFLLFPFFPFFNPFFSSINPELINSSGTQDLEEGCLSVPEIFEKVERYKSIKVKALNEDGKEFEIEAEGLLAVCIQHEMDHLEGKVFVEYLSLLKRDRIKRKMIKKNKQPYAWLNAK